MELENIPRVVQQRIEFSITSAHNTCSFRRADLRSRIIPLIDAWHTTEESSSIGIVPPDLHQGPDLWVMIQHWVCPVRLDGDAIVSASVTVDPCGSQTSVSHAILGEELACCAETVHKRAFATGAIGVRQQVKRLQTSWFCEVGVVRMRLQALGSVCRILALQVRCEVIEAAWMSGQL